MNEPTPEDIAEARPAAPGATVVQFNPERPKRAAVLDTHRLLPQAPDCERGLLCSLLISPRDVFDLCNCRGVTAEWFFIPAHADIFRALLHLDNERIPTDFISLTNYLRDIQMLDKVGGAALITEIFTFLPTAANAGHYVEILDEKRQLRDLIRHATECAARAYDEQDAVDELMDYYEAGALKIRASRFGKVQETTTKQLVIDAITEIESMYETRGQITGLPTGIASLDKITNGLTDERLIIIAARPSMGKTALAMNIVEFLTVDRQVPVLVFSLEMSGQQLMLRMLSSRARVNLQKVRDGFLNERDFPALQAAASALSASPLLIDDFTEATIQYVRAKSRRWVEQNRKRGMQNVVVVIDFLQLLGSGSKRAQFSRELEVGEVSRGAKLMSKELKIPVILIASLNRANVKEKRSPRLHDLRESGSIESDADDVWMLDRDEMNLDPDDLEGMRACAGKASLVIAKQRCGEVNVKVDLTFIKEFTRFEQRAFDDGPPPDRSTKRKNAGSKAFSNQQGLF